MGRQSARGTWVVVTWQGAKPSEFARRSAWVDASTQRVDLLASREYSRVTIEASEAWDSRSRPRA